MSAAGAQKEWGTDVVAMGGAGSISKNRPSHHKYEFLLMAYLKTSGLTGSKRNLCKLGATSLSPF